MIQLQILSGKMAGSLWTARHFPVRVGRGTDNELQLEDPGVWEKHFAIAFDRGTGFTLRAETDALVTVNQQPIRSQILCVGDSIEIGSARLRFWIAEPDRRSLRWSEMTVVASIAAVVGVEIWMLCALIA
jgi:predicted component of type VI protein secretion system